MAGSQREVEPVYPTDRGSTPRSKLPNSSCTLQPGLYVLTGAWDMKNNSLLMGTGVTLYGTCGSAATPSV